MGREAATMGELDSLVLSGHPEYTGRVWLAAAMGNVMDVAAISKGLSGGCAENVSEAKERYQTHTRSRPQRSNPAQNQRDTARKTTPEHGGGLWSKRETSVIAKVSS